MMEAVWTGLYAELKFQKDVWKIVIILITNILQILREIRID